MTMNPDWLLNHFEQISEAPDAVPRLRRFILDLAVRGKLVEQNPADEPASELLKRIRAEKQEHAGRRSCTEQRPFEVDETETPFEIPESWEWVKATEPAVVISDKGKKVQTKDVLEFGEFPVVDQGKVLIRGYCNDVQKVTRVSGPIIVFGDHTRETKLIDFDFVVGADGVKMLKPIEVNPAYYFLALQWVPLDSRGYARHFKLLRASRFPLPPLAEQHRIVAKVDELMALCDEFEAAQAKREKRRDRLVAATLHGLNNGDGSPEPGTRPTFEGSARFYFNHLPRLTTRPEHIRQLRQTILNLAVRGKLVEQNPEDEPASELLKRIEQEKARLVKAGEVRKEKPFPPIDEYGTLFDLPASWRWVPIRKVTVDRGQKIPRKNFSYVDVSAIDKERGLIASTQVLTPDVAPSRARKIVRKGDVIYSCVRPYLLNIAVIEEEFKPEPIVSTAFAVLNGLGLVLPRYLWLVLRSPFFVDCVEGKMRGQAYPAINDGDFAILPFPLPPLAEQHRIVAKVDELMALCDELETRIAETSNIRRRLLEATLHEALKGGI